MFSSFNRQFCTKIPLKFTNRNPRNLEKLRIGYKPKGFHVDKLGKCYWHKLLVKETGRHVTASIIHFERGEVLRASTKEWGIKSQLYKTTDVSAYINLARVLAQRCLQTGLIELNSFLEPNTEKMSCFLKTLEENGVTLQEPEQFEAVRPWDRVRPEKPWEVSE